MPLPLPKNKEKKSEFVSRCISELTDAKEFKSQDQRIAVCYQQFEKAKASADLTIGLANDEFLYSDPKKIKSSEDKEEEEYECEKCGYEGKKAEKCPNCGSMSYKKDEQDGYTENIDEAEAAEASKKLNKPFRTPNGPKKFSVYVKNDKGNVVKVNFGDPNMEIRRDDPERRKNYRARHNCDNPGPKWKANYWSCKMWSSKPVSKIAGSENEIETDDLLETEVESDNSDELKDLKEDLSEMVIGSLGAIKANAENVLNNLSNESVLENLSEPFLQQMAALAEDYVTTIHNYVMYAQEPSEQMEEAEAAKRKGLWENIRNKKRRMGKNYKPAKPGSPDRPDKEAWEKAQK